MKFNENLMRRAFSSNSYLFPEILIRDNPDEVTQILTGFEIVFIKNSIDSNWGFTTFAETWHGRLDMMGFIIGLGTELLNG